MTQAEVEEDLEAEQAGFTPEQIQQIADERAQQSLQPFEKRLAEMEQARGIDIESEAIRGELERLEKDAKVEDRKSVV